MHEQYKRGMILILFDNNGNGAMIHMWMSFQVINEALRCGNIVKFVHRKALKDVRYKGSLPNLRLSLQIPLCSSHDNGSGKGDGCTFLADL